jgi:hypothetical protein
MTVLTEAAAGNFIVTPLIAALAGAKKVYVVCKDTRYGTTDEILDYLEELKKLMGIETTCIEFIEDKMLVAKDVDVVTNSGHVRPIDAKFIAKLKPNAVIPLMFESWEFRPEDIDLDACIDCNVPILGTNERDSRLHIFRYVGMCALKLLLESEIEVYKSNMLLLSSGEYLKEIETVLKNNGASVTSIDTTNHKFSSKIVGIKEFDAIVVAEQENRECLIGKDGICIDTKLISEGCPVIVHIAGVLDYEFIKEHGLKKHPEAEISYGYMTVTTDYVGVRPVIELNAGGLKVGEELHKRMRNNGNYKEAQQYALLNSLAMEFPM